MNGRSLVHVSSIQRSPEPQHLYPGTTTRPGDHQHPPWNNWVPLVRQPNSWSPTSSPKHLIESVSTQGNGHTNTTDPPKKTSCIKVLLIILGLLLTAIALAGMGLGIYAVITIQQERTSSGNTTSVTTSTTTTAVLPAQCFAYAIYNDATRLTTYTASTGGYETGFSTYPTWIRFAGQGGTQLATSAPSMYRCGTTYSGWYTDALPASGSTVVGTVCYVSTTNYCLYNNLIPVTNCSSFYVYGLVSPPTTYARYCTV